MAKEKKVNPDKELKKELALIRKTGSGFSYADKLLAKALSNIPFSETEQQTWDRAKKCYTLLSNGYSQRITAKLFQKDVGLAHEVQSYEYIKLAYEIYGKPNKAIEKEAKRLFLAQRFYDLATVAAGKGNYELEATFLEKAAKLEGLYENNEEPPIKELPKIYKRTTNANALAVNNEVEDVQEVK